MTIDLTKAIENTIEMDLCLLWNQINTAFETFAFKKDIFSVLPKNIQYNVLVGVFNFTVGYTPTTPRNSVLIDLIDSSQARKWFEEQHIVKRQLVLTCRGKEAQSHLAVGSLFGCTCCCCCFCIVVCCFCCSFS